MLLWYHGTTVPLLERGVFTVIESDNILVRQSEIADGIRDLMDRSERTAVEASALTALRTEQKELGPKFRAAKETEGVEAAVIAPADAEERERIELRGKASLSNFLSAAVAGRTPEVEAEYASAMKVGPGQIPTDLFESDRPVESRADSVTPAPATGTGVVVAPVQPFVFSQSIAPRLGIEMPSVPSGSYSEMTISTSQSAAAVTKGSARESTSGALTAVTAKARRISARLSVTLEDIATIGQANFESALRQNTMAALSDAYDTQCINGSGTAPNVDGLVHQLTAPTTPTAIAKFDDLVSAFANSIDGLWSSMMSEVALVVNVDAYRLAAKLFRDATNDRGSISFSDYASLHTAGFWTNSRMPATDSTIARGIVYRKGRMGLRTAVHPTWGVLSVDDIYSDAASGITHFTIHMLVGDSVLLVQPAAYSLVEFKVAA